MNIKRFTKEEVAKHCSKESIWVIIDSKVYDVTNFVSDHPGGVKAILKRAGTDVTDKFNSISAHFEDDSTIDKLKDYFIGYIL